MTRCLPVVHVVVFVLIFCWIASISRCSSVGIVTSLYCWTGEIPPDVSCGNDVEDELALELEDPVDNPGATKGTKFSVLHRICPSLGQLWFLTAGPLVGITVFFTEPA